MSNTEPVLKPVRSSCTVPRLPTTVNARTAGGRRKPQGVLLHSTYDSAASLGATFSALSQVAATSEPITINDHCTLTFASAGDLEIRYTTSDLTILVVVVVPSNSLVVSPNAVRSFRVPIETLAQFNRRWCSGPTAQQHSLTLMYEQNALDNEPIHLMLQPHNGSLASAAIVRATIGDILASNNAGDDDDDDSGEMLPHTDVDSYPIEVVLSAPQHFCSVVAALAADSATLTLLLCDEALELSAIAQDGRSYICVSIARTLAAVGDTDSTTCEYRYRTPHRHVQLSEYRNYRMPSACMARMAASVTTLLASSDDRHRLLLRFGLRNHNDAMPLFVGVQMRSDTDAPIFANYWIAPVVVVVD